VTEEPSLKSQNETDTVRFDGAEHFPVRLATTDDIPGLRRLIAHSVRELQKNDYSAEQLSLAVETVFTLDTLLIADGTYFVIENPAPVGDERIVACGGWSMRSTLCGGDLHAVRDDSFLNPETDAAKIRAFFVHPLWARRGLGTRLLKECEKAAQAAGFTRFEMAATLTGVPLYKARGYHVVESTEVPLCGSSTLQVVIMARSISGRSST
jgi:N-acetylglutamate synthase-like GNAT family acetyltransferase